MVVPRTTGLRLVGMLSRSLFIVGGADDFVFVRAHGLVFEIEIAATVIDEAVIFHPVDEVLPVKILALVLCLLGVFDPGVNR